MELSAATLENEFLDSPRRSGEIFPSASDPTSTAAISVKKAVPRKTVVVIGNGMVGLRFCEKLVEFDTAKQFRIVTFCEEPRAAYDRVGLTSFFAHRDAEKLMLARMEWYHENGVELHLGDRASTIDREQRVIWSQKGV